MSTPKQNHEVSSSAGRFQEAEQPTATQETIIEQRRLKDKTRPAHSSVYDVSLPVSDDKGGLPEKIKEKFRIAASTAEMFSTLFDRARTRGSVNWTAFEAGMADVGFPSYPRHGLFTALCHQRV